MSQQIVQTRSEATASPRPAAEFDLVRVVDRSPLREAPFDHIRMDNVFPVDFYRQLLDALPARDKFHELYHHDAMRSDGSSTRLRMYLYPETLWRLPQAQRRVWRKIVAALSAPALELAFKRKFRAALEGRFQMPAEQVPLYPVPILVRDQPGYRIGVHADALSKAITVQFYLPSDDTQSHLGTIFHTTSKQDGTDQPTAMQFLPATGYAFAVQRKESWHSAPTTTEADGERRSIMLTYYVDEEKKRFKRRYQRLGIFFGRYPKL
jgi:hypothetical protein